jgi:PKD repeat protein
MKGFYLFVLAVFILICFGCSRSGSRYIAGEGISQDASPASRTVNDVLDEVTSYPTPDSHDINPNVFEQLKDELVRQLKERYGDTSRIVANAPTADAGRVTDLAYSEDTQELSWSYVNLGDYDCNGEVGIPDITPIAQNYLAVTNDGIGNDAYESWIDGDKSGEVGISDITPIAQGYLNNIASYQIVTCDTVDGGYSPIGDPVVMNYAGGFPVGVNTPLPAGALEFIAVEPLDSTGTAGERSDPIQIGSGIIPPNIVNIIPLGGLTGVETQFRALVGGTQPMTYNWNFGGGATPNTSTDTMPTVTLGAAGAYSASLTVTNAAGNDLFEFTLNITATAVAPEITNVTPLGGVTGTNLQFISTVQGTSPFTYAWNFGGGAVPNLSSDAEPTVTLGAAGTYYGSLTVTNGAGNDTFDFALEVTATAVEPEITDVTPYSGLTGTDVQFNATVGGTSPFTYAWDFGGGATPNTPSDASPIVVLGASGAYSASLTVTNSVGSDTKNFLLTVTTGEPPDITDVSPDSGDSGTTAQFIATVEGDAPLTFDWDFGGGATPNTSSEESPSVVLGDFGTYDASLTVTNTYGSDTFDFSYEVTENTGTPPDVRNVTPMSGVTGTDIQFTANVVSGTPVTYEWDFGGGGTPNTSSEESPTITLGASGEYYGYVHVSNLYGDDWFNFTLNVTDMPIPPNVYYVEPYEGYANTEVQFNAIVDGTPPLTYDWDFGGGATPNTSTDPWPTVLLGEPGDYHGTLKVTNSEGNCEYGFDYTVMSSEPEIIEVNPVSGGAGAEVQFYSYINGPGPFTYAWDFGGGADPDTSSEEFPIVTLGSAGTYNASLTATNASGSDTFDFELTVYEITWQNETIDETMGVGMHSSLAIDSSDNLHVCYLDSYNECLKYAVWDGSNWNIETPDSNQGVGNYTSLALDSNGYPHIGHYDYWDCDLEYAYWNGTTWTLETIEPAADLGDSGLSLALDSNGYPRFACFDYDNFNLVYIRWDGSSWVTEVVDSEFASGVYCSLALDSNDYPYISYLNWDTGNLKVAKWNGASWDIEVVDNSAFMSDPTTLKFDSGGNPHIAYCDSDNGDLKYASWNGSSWDIEVVDSNGYTGYYSSMALDSNDYPHISYSSGDDQLLRCATWNGASWEVEFVDGSSAVAYTSIALDSTDTPHITYYDWNTETLKHAWPK